MSMYMIETYPFLETIKRHERISHAPIDWFMDIFQLLIQFCINMLALFISISYSLHNIMHLTLFYILVTMAPSMMIIT